MRPHDSAAVRERGGKMLVDVTVGVPDPAAVDVDDLDLYARQRLAIGGEGALVIHAPTSTPASPKGFGPLCRLMTHFHWQDRRLAVAWSIIPKISLRSGADE